MFFEEKVKHFFCNSQKDLKTNFKEIIYLDVWNYSFQSNIPYELILNLFNKLILLNSQNLKTKDILTNLKNRMKITLSLKLSIIEIGLSTKEKSSNAHKDNTTLNELIQKLNNSKELKPTIIILDNIERLNQDFWEIIKSLSAIQKIKNLFFILPLNIAALELNKEITLSGLEFSIEKYLDVAMFEFKQDYLHVLNNLLPNCKINNIISNLLNQSIDNQKLSIRKLEQRFRHNKISFSNDRPHELLQNIVNKVWGNVECYKEYLKTNIISYLNLLEKLSFIFVKIKDSINYFNSFSIPSNIPRQLIPFITYNIIYTSYNNEILKALSYFRNSNNFQFKSKKINYLDYITQSENFIILIKKYKNELKDIISENRKKIESINLNIEKLQMNIIKNEEKITKEKKKIVEADQNQIIIYKQANFKTSELIETQRQENHVLQQNSNKNININIQLNDAKLSSLNSQIQESKDLIKKISNYPDAGVLYIFNFLEDNPIELNFIKINKTTLEETIFNNILTSRIII